MREVREREKPATEVLAWQPEYRFVHTLDRVDCGVGLFDFHARLIHVNRAFRSFFTLPASEFRPGVGLVQLLMRAVERGGCEEGLSDLRAWLGTSGQGPANGSARSAWSPRQPSETISLGHDRWVRISSQRTFDRRLVITLVDVSEHKRRERSLSALNEQVAGEGADLKVFARHLALARAEAQQALKTAEEANNALNGEISQRRALERELRRLADTDELTGAYNRRRFIESTRCEVARSSRYMRPLSVLMIDFDHFKSINDRHGHSAGDEVLRLFCKMACQHLREGDIFARFGGEEFAVLLPETPHERASELAEALRLHTEIITHAHDRLPQDLSITAGIAELRQEDAQPLALLIRADKALYAAKQSGRNCVASIRNDDTIVILKDGEEQHLRPGEDPSNAMQAVPASNIAGMTCPQTPTASNAA